MPGSTGHRDGGGGEDDGPAAVTEPAPEPEEAAPRPPPEADDAATALRLALDQLSALGLGGARPAEDRATGDAAGTQEPEASPLVVAPSAEPPVAVASLVAGAPLAMAPSVAVATSVSPGALPLLDPDVSPPPLPPRPSPPDVFAALAPHPAILGPPTLLAEQMSVIGSRKKSVNMTECVPVPSSEHVAEIVGRQGCKIKALRAKTNTYIKTPVRGEEPVFIVTGRKEDVELAKREILSAAEHFSLIRATRGKAGGMSGSAPGPPNLPGQTTIQVRVPYRVVGLVVGPKGATIKRIQQRTHTYIVTPGRDKEPVFAVTGMPENVDRAREEIEAHITWRTGALTDSGPDSDFHANGTDVCLDLLGAAAGLWAKAPRPGRRPPQAPGGLRGDGVLGAPEAFYSGSRGGPSVAEPGPASPYGGSGHAGFTFGGDGPGAPSGSAASEDCDFGFDFLALDLTVPAAATIWAPFERAGPLPGFGGGPAVNGAPAPPPPGARGGSGAAATPRHSPTLPEPAGLGLDLPLGRRGAPDPVGPPPWRPPPSALPPFSAAPSGPGSPSDGGAAEGARQPPASSAAPGPSGAALARECVVCAEGEAMAALVPCGHNLFCMDCAVRICGRSEPQCPACRSPATQAIHIFS